MAVDDDVPRLERSDPGVITDEMPRAAFEIVVNGKPVCESDDVPAITTVSEDVPRTDRLRISIHASGGEGNLHWLEAALAICPECLRAGAAPSVGPRA
jgi:hypothetical protein